MLDLFVWPVRSTLTGRSFVLAASWRLVDVPSSRHCHRLRPVTSHGMTFNTQPRLDTRSLEKKGTKFWRKRTPLFNMQSYIYVAVAYGRSRSTCEMLPPFHQIKPCLIDVCDWWAFSILWSHCCFTYLVHLLELPQLHSMSMTPECS